MLSLTELFARESGLVREFIGQLSAEQAALTSGDVDALAPINARKAEIAEQLNAADGERSRVLRSAGFGGQSKDLLAWLVKSRGDRSAAGEWSKLLKLAAKARELNNLNGQLIAMRLQATNQALAVLSQQAQRSALYGPDGQSVHRTGSRIIDAA